MGLARKALNVVPALPACRPDQTGSGRLLKTVRGSNRLKEIKRERESTKGSDFLVQLLEKPFCPSQQLALGRIIPEVQLGNLDGF